MYTLIEMLCDTMESSRWNVCGSLAAQDAHFTTLGVNFGCLIQADR